MKHRFSESVQARGTAVPLLDPLLAGPPRRPVSAPFQLAQLLSRENEDESTPETGKLRI